MRGEEKVRRLPYFLRFIDLDLFLCLPLQSFLALKFFKFTHFGL